MKRPRFHIGALSPILGSLILALVLILLDVVFGGGCLLSSLVIPIWFLVALFRSLSVERTNPGIAVARIAMPVVIGVIVFGNDTIQSNTAQAHAEQIVKACKSYRDDNGSYPKELSDLVPRYLSSVPPAKYCLGSSAFGYNSNGEHTLLWWVNTPPFGRKLYDFQSGEWGGVD